MGKRTLLSVVCLLGFTVASAGVLTVKETKEIVRPPCGVDGTCDVKEIGFWVRDYVVDISTTKKATERNYGTALYAWYETSSLTTLEDFIFVQFMRGCMYNSSTRNGEVRVYPTLVHTHHGEDGIPFVHPEWVVDSRDSDPAYGTSAPIMSGRHDGLKWSESLGGFPSSILETRYGTKKPDQPLLYMTDFLSQAQYGEYPQGFTVAENVSLEFRTCLYRTKDVPTTIPVDGTISAEPLACHEWRSSYIFDHAKKKFSSPKGISPVCKVLAAELASKEK